MSSKEEKELQGIINQINKAKIINLQPLIDSLDPFLPKYSVKVCESCLNQFVSVLTESKLSGDLTPSVIHVLNVMVSSQEPTILSSYMKHPKMLGALFSHLSTPNSDLTAIITALLDTNTEDMANYIAGNSKVMKPLIEGVKNTSHPELEALFIRINGLTSEIRNAVRPLIIGVLKQLSANVLLGVTLAVPDLKLKTQDLVDWLLTRKSYSILDVTGVCDFYKEIWTSEVLITLLKKTDPTEHKDQLENLIHGRDAVNHQVTKEDLEEVSKMLSDEHSELTSQALQTTYYFPRLYVIAHCGLYKDSVTEAARNKVFEWVGSYDEFLSCAAMQTVLMWSYAGIDPPNAVVHRVACVAIRTSNQHQRTLALALLRKLSQKSTLASTLIIQDPQLSFKSDMVFKQNPKKRPRWLFPNVYSLILDVAQINVVDLTQSADAISYINDTLCLSPKAKNNEIVSHQSD